MTFYDTLAACSSGPTCKRLEKPRCRHDSAPAAIPVLNSLCRYPHCWFLACFLPPPFPMLLPPLVLASTLRQALSDVPSDPSDPLGLTTTDSALLRGCRPGPTTLAASRPVTVVSVKLRITRFWSYHMLNTVLPVSGQRVCVLRCGGRWGDGSGVAVHKGPGLLGGAVLTCQAAVSATATAALT